jgi:hypothetical protein
LRRILFRARHNDRRQGHVANGLPTDFFEQLFIGSGRPVLMRE